MSTNVWRWSKNHHKLDILLIQKIPRCFELELLFHIEGFLSFYDISNLLNDKKLKLLILINVPAIESVNIDEIKHNSMLSLQIKLWLFQSFFDISSFEFIRLKKSCKKRLSCINKTNVQIVIEPKPINTQTSQNICHLEFINQLFSYLIVCAVKFL